MRESSPSSTSSHNVHNNQTESETAGEGYTEDSGTDSDSTYTESEPEASTANTRRRDRERQTAHEQYGNFQPEKRNRAAPPMFQALPLRSPQMPASGSHFAPYQGYERQGTFSTTHSGVHPNAPQSANWYDQQPQLPSFQQPQWSWPPQRGAQSNASPGMPENYYVYHPSMAQQQRGLPSPFLSQTPGGGMYRSPDYGNPDRGWYHSRSESGHWYQQPRDAHGTQEHLGEYDLGLQPTHYGSGRDVYDSGLPPGPVDRENAEGAGTYQARRRGESTNISGAPTLEPSGLRPTESSSSRLYSHETVSQFPSLIGQIRLVDDAGQTPPSGVANSFSRTSTALWEEEGTICLVVVLRGMAVTRRCDNNMINGTKLLNSANITRGRRDGVLKGERVRNVVKIGGMDFKGVWIPFERALEMARRENVLDLLYPLFVADLHDILYNRSNISRLHQLLAKGSRRNPRFLEWYTGIPRMQPSDSAFLQATTMPQRPTARPATQYQFAAPLQHDEPASPSQSYRFPPSRESQELRGHDSRRRQGHRHSQSTTMEQSQLTSQLNLDSYSRSLRQAREARKRRGGQSQDASSSYRYPDHFPRGPRGKSQSENRDADPQS